MRFPHQVVGVEMTTHHLCPLCARVVADQAGHYRSNVTRQTFEDWQRVFAEPVRIVTDLR